MEINLGRFIQSCEKCQKTRKSQEKPDLLTPLPGLHADQFGGLTTSKKSKKYILCMTDAFTNEAGATFDNSFFDNSFLFLRQFKNRSFLDPVFVHVTGRS